MQSATVQSGRCPTEGCTLMMKMGCAFQLCSRCCRKKLLRRTELETVVNCKVHNRKFNKYVNNKIESVGESLSLKTDVEIPDIDEVVDMTPYKSASRVLLVGIGADEQMGGYGRHRTVYNKGLKEHSSGAPKIETSDSFIEKGSKIFCFCLFK